MTNRHPTPLSSRYVTPFLSFFLVLLFVLPVQADQYGDLLKEFQEHAPERFYSDHLVSLQQNQPVLGDSSSSKEELSPVPQPLKPPARELTPQHFFTPDSAIMKKITHESATDTLFTKGISLPTFLAVVSLRNPKIQASTERVDASRESIRQAANLDAILQQYTAFTNTLMNGVGPMKGTMIAEKFPFPALASLKGRIAQQNVIIAQEKHEQTIRSVITSSQQQFWDLLYNQEAQELTTNMIHLLEHLETVARSRYETGKSGFQELILVQISLESLKEKRITLTESLVNIEEKIRQLTDLPKLMEIGSPMVDKAHETEAIRLQKASLPELNRIAQAHRQELRIERARITKMELLIDLAESMILPPFTMNLANFNNNPIQQIGNTPRAAFPTSITAKNGAGLPKSPWFGSNDAFLIKTRHLLAARKRSLHNMETETRAIIRDKWFKLDAALRNVTLYRSKIVDLSESALHVVTQGYETGETPFAQVNISYQNWLNARLTLAESISAVGIAKSKLVESLGIEDQIHHD